MAKRAGDDDAETQPGASRPRTSCPYMDTINRAVLDFDFDKVCSVSLETHHVYACLVCGRYFQGRGVSSHAYVHALDLGHHLFLNLETERAYCLPEGYEVVDRSLDDIRGALNPRFDDEDIASLDRRPSWCRSVDGDRHLRGVMGLNNLHATDYMNVVIQVFGAITPLRNFYLQNWRGTALVERLGQLIRRMWAKETFRNHISPHEFVQEVANRSKRNFSLLKTSDPAQFLVWLLNTLHNDMKRNTDRAGRHSVISSIFQGKLQVMRERDDGPEETSMVPFFMLALELPPKPLFRNNLDKNSIQQIQLKQLLSKYDGISRTHVVRTDDRVRYIVATLPRILIFHIQRFAKASFTKEKNPAVVLFPWKDLDMSPYTQAKQDSGEIYDLNSAIIYEGEGHSGRYRAFILHKASGKWFDMCDIQQKETMPQLVVLSEARLLIYERRNVAPLHLQPL